MVAVSCLMLVELVSVVADLLIGVSGNESCLSHNVTLPVVKSFSII